MLRVQELSKRYDEQLALKGVDLDIQPGEICALLGPNGAGKTTLVSIVAGLVTPDSGSVSVNGTDIAQNPRVARRQLGLAPQELGIFPSLSVKDNLVFFGELAGLRAGDLRRRIAEIAEGFDLVSLMSRRAGQLSGGEKRRVHTAAAVLHEPRVLLLDEPTAGVDVKTRQQILHFVRSVAERGTAVCYSTHYLPEVEMLGASLALIDAGSIVARGIPRELLSTESAGVAIECKFKDSAPSIVLPTCVVERADDNTVRIRADDPTTEVAALIDALGPWWSQVFSLEIIRPSLESYYLAKTGRRYDPTSQPDVAYVSP